LQAEEKRFLTEVSAGIPTTTLMGKRVHVYKTVTSTNDIAKRLLETQRQNGIMVVAEEQTRARGRRGTAWHSPATEGLTFSLLLPAERNFDQFGVYALLSGLAVASAIEAITALPTELKWPNDVLMKGKKVCGILIETTASENECNGIIIGIGVNVNQMSFPDQLQNKATSLRIVTGQTVSRKKLLYEIVARLEKNYLRLQRGCGPQIIRDWKAKCRAVDRRLWIRSGGVRMQARFADVDDLGRMLVLIADGRQIVITSREYVEFEDIDYASGH
jgi:BirA family biotin operon repressor/biotin-[acetyl-CoA-carboxylase] ligase